MSMTTHSAFLPRVPTLVAEHIECALADACRRGHAEIIEWAIAPHAPGTEDDSDRFDVLIEFAEPARAPAAFVHAFDETLQRLNAAYRDMRVHGRAPRILEVPPGTFGRWLTGRSEADPDVRVAPVAHDRTAADEVLAVVSERRQAPIVLEC
jgi:hypothetical protein